jgi:hypothetical protein
LAERIHTSLWQVYRNANAQNEIVRLRRPQCSEENPCGLCQVSAGSACYGMPLSFPHQIAFSCDSQGDCDSNLECEGDLICVQRDESKHGAQSDNKVLPVGSAFFVYSWYLFVLLTARWLSTPGPWMQRHTQYRSGLLCIASKPSGTTDS